MFCIFPPFFVIVKIAVVHKMDNEPWKSVCPEGYRLKGPFITDISRGIST